MGPWRSLVARVHGMHEVAGPNPAGSTAEDAGPNPARALERSALMRVRVAESLCRPSPVAQVAEHRTWG